MEVPLFIALIVGMMGGVGGTLMALGFLHSHRYDESDEGDEALPAERLGQGFIVTGAILGLLFGLARLACFFELARFTF